jgi:DHA2 family multidrug resistance protein
LVLIFWELRVKEPIIDLGLLRNSALAIGSIIGLLYCLALYGTTFILPQFTQSLMGYSAYQSGLTLLPRALALFILMPVAGLLYNHIDAKILIISGIGLICWSYQLLAGISMEIAFSNFMPILFLMGVGMALVYVPLTTVSLITIANKDMTHATSLFSLMQRIGGNIGYAVTVTILERRIQFHRYNLVENISTARGTFLSMYHVFLEYLHKNGYGPVHDRLVALSFFNRLVNQQAAMLSYNDLSWIFMVMFLLMIIFVLFLPHSKTIKSINEIEIIDETLS